MNNAIDDTKNAAALIEKKKYSALSSIVLFLSNTGFITSISKTIQPSPTITDNEQSKICILFPFYLFLKFRCMPFE